MTTVVEVTISQEARDVLDRAFALAELDASASEAMGPWFAGKRGPLLVVRRLRPVKADGRYRAVLEVATPFAELVDSLAREGLMATPDRRRRLCCTMFDILGRLGLDEDNAVHMSAQMGKWYDRHVAESRRREPGWPPDLLDMCGLAHLLSTSTRQVQRLLSRGALPPADVNLSTTGGPKGRRWQRDRVLAFLEAGGIR